MLLETQDHGSISTQDFSSNGKSRVKSIIVELDQKLRQATVYMNCALMGTLPLEAVPREFTKKPAIRVVSVKKLLGNSSFNI